MRGVMHCVFVRKPNPLFMPLFALSGFVLLILSYALSAPAWLRASGGPPTPTGARGSEPVGGGRICCHDALTRT